MKRNAFLAMILMIAATFTACKKDKIEYRNDFETSFKAWQNFKAESRNNYSYTTSTSSWTGYSTETTITVINGKITSRAYVAKGIKDDQTHAIYILEEWREDSTTLNSHKNGAQTLTLDQIYDLAKNDLLLKRANTKTYFEAKNDGIISSAGYVEDNCADDCFNGISIRSVTNLFPLITWKSDL
jgi:hypothetical protein